jgi:hypothetical protein
MIQSNLMNADLDQTSLLLLYLTDEMSAEDRRDVERRLKSDPALARELESLRATHDTIHRTLAMVDAQRNVPLSQEAAVRRFARDAAQWRVDQMNRPPVEVRKDSRWRTRAYAMGGVAAVIAITSFFYWRMAKFEHDQFASTQHSDAVFIDPSDPMSEGRPENPDPTVADADIETTSMQLASSFSAGLPSEDRDRLGKAEDQLQALSLLTDSVR